MNAERVRVSVGTAAILGLVHCKYRDRPTTAYFMTYTQGKCIANCGFCPQARTSNANPNMLSRVTWPVFSTKQVLESLKTRGNVKRVCIQALNYPQVFEDLLSLISQIRDEVIPVTVSIQPLKSNQITEMRDSGIERIGIPIDAATPKIFEEIKGKGIGGPYEWRKHIQTLDDAVRIFGKRRVSTHLIVGLGETEEEAIKFLQMIVNRDVIPALFAFTPIRGTKLHNRPQPSIDSYRRIQVGSYLIVNNLSTYKKMHFDSEGKLCNFGLSPEQIEKIVERGKPFLTSGCPDCNRPYYNERPKGTPYNYPRPPSFGEIEIIKQELGIE